MLQLCVECVWVCGVLRCVDVCAFVCVVLFARWCELWDSIGSM